MTDTDERLHQSAVSTARLLEVQSDPEVMAVYDQMGHLMQVYAGMLLRGGVSPLAVLSQLSTVPGAAWCTVMGIGEVKIVFEDGPDDAGE